MPWIVMAPSIIAMMEFGDTERRSGMKDDCAPALFADSSPATRLRLRHGRIFPVSSRSSSRRNER